MNYVDLALLDAVLLRAFRTISFSGLRISNSSPPGAGPLWAGYVAPGYNAAAAMPPISCLRDVENTSFNAYPRYWKFFFVCRDPVQIHLLIGNVASRKSSGLARRIYKYSVYITLP